jgi:hypothetical protein
MEVRGQLQAPASLPLSITSVPIEEETGWTPNPTLPLTWWRKEKIQPCLCCNDVIIFTILRLSNEVYYWALCLCKCQNCLGHLVSESKRFYGSSSYIPLCVHGTMGGRCEFIHSTASLFMTCCLELTDWLTSWRRVLLEKLTVTHLVKKYPAFYGTQKFITVFTRARHWLQSWARCIQSTPSHPISLRSILILSTPRSYERTLPLSFPNQNIVCIFHLSCVLHALHIAFYLTSNTHTHNL